jgi:hypothetical protein
MPSPKTTAFLKKHKKPLRVLRVVVPAFLLALILVVAVAARSFAKGRVVDDGSGDALVYVHDSIATIASPSSSSSTLSRFASVPSAADALATVPLSSSSSSSSSSSASRQILSTQRRLLSGTGEVRMPFLFTPAQRVKKCIDQ